MDDNTKNSSEFNYDEFSFADIAQKPQYMTEDYQNSQVRFWQQGQGPGQQPTASPPMQEAPPGQYSGLPVNRHRIVKAVENFWVPMDIPYTATANENITAYSKSTDFDVFILGAWTNTGTSLVKLTQTNEGVELSVDSIPIQTFAGVNDTVSPVRFWKPPTYLPAQSVLRGDFINLNADAASTVSFMTLKRGSEFAIKVRRSARFYLLVDMSATSLISFTSAIDHPLLIWGARADVATAGVNIQITDDRFNYSWSSDPMKVPSFAGLQGTVQPIVYYPRPYLLQPRARLKAQFSAATANSFMTFICERLLDYEYLVDGPPKQVQPPHRIVSLSNEQQAQIAKRKLDDEARLQYQRKLAALQAQKNQPRRK